MNGGPGPAACSLPDPHRINGGPQTQFGDTCSLPVGRPDKLPPGDMRYLFTMSAQAASLLKVCIVLVLGRHELRHVCLAISHRQDGSGRSRPVLADRPTAAVGRRSRRVAIDGGRVLGRRALLPPSLQGRQPVVLREQDAPGGGASGSEIAPRDLRLHQFGCSRVNTLHARRPVQARNG